MSRTTPSFYLLLLHLLLCAGCAQTARNTALHMQSHDGFTPQRYDTGHFVLFGLLRPAAQPGTQADTLHVYIEGDGFAWASRTRASDNPTPVQAVALRLAQADKSRAAVLYLARPCQYVTGADARRCDVRYWTNARLAPEVIASLDAAITTAKESVGARRIALIGYSGGGGAAALIAARREDVVFLGTVAGTLDHRAWTQLHRVSQLNASLNPLDVAPRLRDLPQRHISSPADAVMPPSISKTFCERAGQPQSCISVPGITHDGPWEQVWGANPYIYDRP